ncbi:MAG TPA: response regulator [Kofleriaceae bacterium]|nr:response regulator [Kofleriaceae bacterium]
MDPTLSSTVDLVRGTRLLVVDDDSAMRQWLKDLLATAGASLREAASGLEALTLLANETPFDMVVTDVCMPTPSGVQLVAMARTAGYSVPFLVMTAFPSDKIMSAVDGIDDAILLHKPFGASELFGAMLELLGLGSQRNSG